MIFEKRSDIINCIKYNIVNRRILTGATCGAAAPFADGSCPRHLFILGGLMHRLFKKSEILTIPNILSFFRLALVPLIAWVYIGLQNYYLAIGLIVLSGLTDIVDGKIARKFNMISDFGKILDPIADKVTQGILIICLSTRYKLMIVLVAIFVIKEAVMLLMGYLVLRKNDSVNGAKWYGKLNTVVLYAVCVLLIMFPQISPVVANTMITICGVLILFSFVQYALFYRSILKSDSEK